ncbi:MAG: DUF433 domain-containing protein [Pirellulales bacterium]|nr:DUF433 domain-containing protein [Pirellulales bacterium]
MSTVEYAHLSQDEFGAPIVTGTGTKVIQIVGDHVYWGWDAEQIHRQHPDLNLGQIHSALSYYYDHQAEMDAELKRRAEIAEEIKAQLGPGPAADKLKATGRLT